ncbi:MAG: MEDS domain-containing protein [Desulfohalobiaceae bacterium]|nr:MEDS domain-containing protein [Desulfohalobiaceae bacterium]
MIQKQRKISMGFSDEKLLEGQHIIYLYNDDRERKKTMASFLQQGLLENEKLLYLVDDISPEEMQKELSLLGVDVQRVNNCFDITAGHYACCPDHYFTAEFMLKTVGEFYEQAIQNGFTGARGAGEMSWALVEGRATVEELLNYEAQLNHILQRHPLTTVCQYDARRFDGALIMDLLSVHPMMIVRGQLVKNPSYVKPEIFLQEYRERQQRSSRLDH